MQGGEFMSRTLCRVTCYNLTDIFERENVGII